jgi:hypothetical protein
MLRVFYGSLAVVALLLAGMMSMGSRAAGQAAPAEPDFGTKVLMVTCRDGRTRKPIEGVRLRKLAGESFLVGKSVEGWQKGQTVWMAVGDISQMVEYATAEEYRSADNAQNELERNL